MSLRLPQLPIFEIAERIEQGEITRDWIGHLYNKLANLDPSRWSLITESCIPVVIDDEGWIQFEWQSAEEEFLDPTGSQYSRSKVLKKSRETLERNINYAKLLGLSKEEGSGPRKRDPKLISLDPLWLICMPSSLAPNHVSFSLRLVLEVDGRRVPKTFPLVAFRFTYRRDPPGGSNTGPGPMRSVYDGSTISLCEPSVMTPSIPTERFSLISTWATNTYTNVRTGVERLASDLGSVYSRLNSNLLDRGFGTSDLRDEQPATTLSNSSTGHSSTQGESLVTDLGMVATHNPEDEIRIPRPHFFDKPNDKESEFRNSLRQYFIL